MMRRKVVVVGLGRFGTGVVKALHGLHIDVMAIDQNPEAIQEVASLATHAVRVEAFNQESFNKLSLSNFDIGIVAIGSDMESSILATLLLKMAGIPYVIARAKDVRHGEILEKIGADRVVYAEQEIGERIGQESILGDVAGYISAAPGFVVSKIKVKPSLVGQSLSELGLSRPGRFGLTVLFIQRKNEAIITPDQGQTIEPGDILFLYGSEDRLREFLAKEPSNGKIRA